MRRHAQTGRDTATPSTAADTSGRIVVEVSRCRGGGRCSGFVELQRRFLHAVVFPACVQRDVGTLGEAVRVLTRALAHEPSTVAAMTPTP
jgi:hypothetical protein